MEEDQYEDDTAATHAAWQRALDKLILGASIVGLLALVFSEAGLL